MPEDQQPACPAENQIGGSEPSPQIRYIHRDDPACFSPLTHRMNADADATPAIETRAIEADKERQQPECPAEYAWMAPGVEASDPDLGIVKIESKPFRHSGQWSVTTRDKDDAVRHVCCHYLRRIDAAPHSEAAALRKEAADARAQVVALEAEVERLKGRAESLPPFISVLEKLIEKSGLKTLACRDLHDGAYVWIGPAAHPSSHAVGHRFWCPPGMNEVIIGALNCLPDLVALVRNGESQRQALRGILAGLAPVVEALEVLTSAETNNPAAFLVTVTAVYNRVPALLAGLRELNRVVGVEGDG